MADTILVCMPTYHGPFCWLKQAVESVQRQTYNNFKCWIVKDGCECGVRWSDKYERESVKECKNCKKRMEYMREIAQQDTRFKVFTLPINFNAAGWGPRNFALLNTTHDFIAYLDDDNWWEPCHLEVVYNHILKTNVDFVFSGSKTFSVTGEELTQKSRNNMTPGYCCIDTSEILHKRRLFDEIGGWRWQPECCDWDLVERWLQKGATWSHTSIYTVNYCYRGVCGGTPREILVAENF